MKCYQILHLAKFINILFRKSSSRRADISLGWTSSTTIPSSSTVRVLRKIILEQSWFLFWKKDSSKTWGGKETFISTKIWRCLELRTSKKWNGLHPCPARSTDHWPEVPWPKSPTGRVKHHSLVMFGSTQIQRTSTRLIGKKWKPQMLVGSLIQHSEPVIHIVRYCFCVDVLVKGPYPPLHRQMFEGAGLKRFYFASTFRYPHPRNPNMELLLQPFQMDENTLKWSEMETLMFEDFCRNHGFSDSILPRFASNALARAVEVGTRHFWRYTTFSL